MNLKRFTIITEDKSQQTESISSILINIEHIVSIKPIKLTMKDQEVVDGFWVRLSNGKKYRAVQIPKEILTILKQDLPAIKKSDDSVHSFNYQ